MAKCAMFCKIKTRYLGRSYVIVLRMQLVILKRSDIDFHGHTGRLKISVSPL